MNKTEPQNTLQVDYDGRLIPANFIFDNSLDVKIKKLHKDAVIPKYAKPGDAAMDLTCISSGYKDSCHIYGTGLAVEIPEGYVGLLFPRSSLTKYDLALGNHVGVIDSSYRGEIIFKFKELHPEEVLDYINDDGEGHYQAGRRPKYYSVGDRIGQLLIIPYPKINLVEVTELSETERGTGGYGSSDQKEAKKG